MSTQSSREISAAAFAASLGNAPTTCREKMFAASTAELRP